MFFNKSQSRKICLWDLESNAQLKILAQPITAIMLGNLFSIFEKVSSTERWRIKTFNLKDYYEDLWNHIKNLGFNIYFLNTLLLLLYHSLSSMSFWGTILREKKYTGICILDSYCCNSKWPHTRGYNTYNYYLKFL